MRRFLFLLVPLAAACSTASGGDPSLAPRAAETIDPRVPVADPVLPAEADPQLVRRLDALAAQAQTGDSAFQAAAAEARRLVAAAGAPQSESWVVAQQALSRAIGARAPVTRALGEIDDLAGDRLNTDGGIGAANLRAIKAAADHVAEIDAREAAAISAMQAALRR